MQSKGLCLHVVYGHLHSLSPGHLGDGSHCLPYVRKHPVLPLDTLCVVVGVSLFDTTLHHGEHVSLYVLHPDLDPGALAADLDPLELDLLPLGGYHTAHVRNVAPALHEDKSAYVVETLVNVLLYCFDVLCIREYLQQLIVREEVEPWELLSLLLQVLLEVLLDPIELLVVAEELLKLLSRVAVEEYVLLIVDDLHELVPLARDELKFLGVFGAVLADV